MADQVVTLPDPVAVAREAARRFARLAQEAAESHGRFSVALSGGSTPGLLYRLLAEQPARSQIPWQSVHLFWGDERCVPPDDPESNYRLAHEALVAHVPIPPENVHRVLGELVPAEAARMYAKALHDFFCGPRARFDLVLLGLGTDGHTAGLFPGSPTLRERERLSVATLADYQDRPVQRVTLTLPAINSARQVLFLVTGAGKAQILKMVLEGPGTDLPARQINPVAGEVIWLVDAAAASCLTASG